MWVKLSPTQQVYTDLYSAEITRRWRSHTEQLWLVDLVHVDTPDFMLSHQHALEISALEEPHQEAFKKMVCFSRHIFTSIVNPVGYSWETLTWVCGGRMMNVFEKHVDVRCFLFGAVRQRAIERERDRRLSADRRVFLQSSANVSWGLCDGSYSRTISTNALPESDVSAGEFRKHVSMSPSGLPLLHICKCISLRTLG